MPDDGANEIRAAGRDFELRLGVRMPDWSAITDLTAGEALGASMAAAGRADKWSGLGAEEDRVWQAALRQLARSGPAPDSLQLAAATGLPASEVIPLLSALRRRDLVVLNEDGTTIVAAYPFSVEPTAHRVRLGAESAAAYALCAIDALGAGAMFACDTVIESSCAECGEPIRIVTCGGGRALRSVTPSSTVVWSGIRYAGGCCATSGCMAKLFFCSDSHLAAWRRRADSSGVGSRLSADAALQVGMAIFVPMLTSPGWA